MEVASELGVDEVVDHGIDQSGGHGQQVDYPGTRPLSREGWLLLQN